jgi:Protein of unknown function (DUF2865)
MGTAKPAHTVAATMAALLATLALGTTSRYAGGAIPAPGAGLRAWDAGLKPAERGLPRRHLANSADSGPFSFLQGLFGMPAPPRRPSAGRARPHRDLPRQGRGWRGRMAPTSPMVSKEPRGTGVATYRTLCVRLCDGYYWPISFATHEAHFGRDNEACKKSCSAPVALYYHPNPGGTPEEMVSLAGVPYKTLGTAFLYRASYDASCKCRPHPWEPEAMDRRNTQAKQVGAAQRRKR